MTITALASAYASPPRGTAPPASVSRAEAQPSDAAASRSDAAQRSRRNPLMDAMLSATAQSRRVSSDQPVEGAAKLRDSLKADSGAADAAVAQFAHALMDDLRTLAGSGEGRGWSDLSGSVAALAVKAAAGGGGSMGASVGASVAASAGRDASGGAGGGAGAKAAGAADEVPPQPNPLTPTTAAVHLMQVPSSHLMKAYAAMRQAIPQAEPPAPKAAEATPAPPGDAARAKGDPDPAAAKSADPQASKAADPADERAELAQFLQKLSQSLAPKAAEAPSLNGLGTLLDTSA